MSWFLSWVSCGAGTVERSTDEELVETMRSVNEYVKTVKTPTERQRKEIESKRAGQLTGLLLRRRGRGRCGNRSGSHDEE